MKVLKVLKPVEHQQKLESIEGIFPKDLENWNSKWIKWIQKIGK